VLYRCTEAMLTLTRHTCLDIRYLRSVIACLTKVVGHKTPLIRNCPLSGFYCEESMSNRSNSITCRKGEMEADSASKNGIFLVSNVHLLLDGSALPGKLIFRYCYTMQLRKYTIYNLLQ